MKPSIAVALTRPQKKRVAIVEAAVRLFLDSGFDGTSMDDVAAKAGVSKPTLYRYFADKDGLYAAAVQATVDDVDHLLRLVAEELASDVHPRKELRRLAIKMLSALMRPDLLRLRRLVIAQADKFPEVGQNWFSQGFGRVLDTLAAAFSRYDKSGYLRVRDPMLAANHFAGLLLWIPLNRAMFTGQVKYDISELETYANAAVEAFLEGYGSRRR